MKNPIVVQSTQAKKKAKEEPAEDAMATLPISQIRNPYEILQPAAKFPTNFPAIFDFLIFVFFSLSPYVIVFYLYLLVICNGLGGMKHCKTRLCRH